MIHMFLFVYVMVICCMCCNGRVMRVCDMCYGSLLYVL